MNCEKARQMILGEGFAKAEELKDHLAACKDCASLASAWETFESLKPSDTPAPSPALDIKIMDAAQSYLVDRKKHQKMVFVRRIAIYATAACCVFATWTALHTIGHDARVQQKPNMVTKSQPHANWQKNAEMDIELYNLATELELGIMDIYTDTGYDNGLESEFDLNILDLSTYKTQMQHSS